MPSLFDIFGRTCLIAGVVKHLLKLLYNIVYA